MRLGWRRPLQTFQAVRNSPGFTLEPGMPLFIATALAAQACREWGGRVNHGVTLGWEPGRKEGLSGASRAAGKRRCPCAAAPAARLTMRGKAPGVSEGPSVVAQQQVRTVFATSECLGRSCFGFLSVVSGLLPNLAFVPLRRLWSSRGFAEVGVLKRLVGFRVLNHAGCPGKYRFDVSESENQTRWIEGGESVF